MSEFVNGMIFVCDENTSEDMFKYQIFGLPLTYLREMKLLVQNKSALFLLEKQTNLIRGIFVPTSNAKKLIVSDIWLHQDQCSFPSQIRFKLHSSFAALPKDSEFAPQFLRRMKVKGKFLDRSRVRSLVTALTSFQGAVKTEQERYRNLHSIPNTTFPQFFPPSFPNYSSAYASLSFLQQQNELLRLENQVLKVRSQAEAEAEELYREREELLRAHRAKTDETFGAMHPFDFERFKDLLEHPFEDFQYYEHDGDYQEFREEFNEVLNQDDDISQTDEVESTALKRRTHDSYSRNRIPFNINAAQHFKSSYNDEIRHDWDSMLPPIPRKYDDARWASPNHTPESDSSNSRTNSLGRGLEFDPLELEHSV